MPDIAGKEACAPQGALDRGRKLEARATFRFQRFSFSAFRILDDFSFSEFQLFSFFSKHAAAIGLLLVLQARAGLVCCFFSMFLCDRGRSEALPRSLFLAQCPD
jgi:hypothetical protein